MKNNIALDTTSIFLTDNFLLGNLVKEILNAPVIAFQNISNSYMILKEIKKTNVKNITFILKPINMEKNIDYITNLIGDLSQLGYNLNVKYVVKLEDFFDEEINVKYTLNKVA